MSFTIPGTGPILLPASSTLASSPAAGDSSLQIATTAFTNGTSLFTVQGYQKLPSGLIIQWGTASTSAAGAVTITWPIAFPTAITSFVGNAIGAASAGNSSITSGALNRTQGVIYGTYGASGAVGSAQVIQLNYIAIGY